MNQRWDKQWTLLRKSLAHGQEFKSLEEKNTWELDENPHSKPLPAHIVLKIKRDAEGKVNRLKARIVAGGNHQCYGDDCKETYAPVVPFSLVRLFLYVALSLSFVIAQIDVKTAFINGNLEEDVWVMSPGVSQVCFSPRFYKLKKALYGLKQAHLAWHKKLCLDLHGLGFVELPSAPSVFQRQSNKFCSYILVYVDDLIIIYPTQDELESVINSFESFMTHADLRRWNCFLEWI